MKLANHMFGLLQGFLLGLEEIHFGAPTEGCDPSFGKQPYDLTTLSGMNPASSYDAESMDCTRI